MGLDVMTSCKAISMAKLLRRERRSHGLPHTVLSIGDSCREQAAVKDVLWGWDGEAELLCKTVKFVPDPTVEILGCELTMLTRWMQDIVDHNGDFDFVFRIVE